MSFLFIFPFLCQTSESPVEHLLLLQVTFECGVLALKVGTFQETLAACPPFKQTTFHDIYNHINTLKELRKFSFRLNAESAYCGRCLQHRCPSSQSS